jgi:hypothetical protein
LENLGGKIYIGFIYLYKENLSIKKLYAFETFQNSYITLFKVKKEHDRVHGQIKEKISNDKTL